MITLPNTTYKASDISLSAILNSTTKVNMLTVLKKFDLYASPNLKKDETARRIAMEVIDNPIEILSRLNKTDYLVVTYCDEEKGEWHMLMPKELRESLSESLPFFLDLSMKGVKAPSAKELRMMSMMNCLLGDH